MKYKCIKAFRGIPIGVICEVKSLTSRPDIYITYNGRTYITNWTTLKQHFEEVTV